MQLVHTLVTFIVPCDVDLSPEKHSQAEPGIELEDKHNVKKFPFPLGQKMGSDKMGFNILFLDDI